MMKIKGKLASVLAIAKVATLQEGGGGSWWWRHDWACSQACAAPPAPPPQEQGSCPPCPCLTGSIH